MISKDTLEQEILLGFGIIVRISRNLKVSPATVYNWIHKYDLMEFLENARDLISDSAYSTVIDNIDDVQVALKLLSLRKSSSSGFKVNVDKESGITITVNSTEDVDALDKFLE